MSDPRAGYPKLLLVLSVLLFLSGASALIYQVLWLRLLGLVFGVTVYAASTVWAVFMAGLALGSIAGGRAADRLHRPLVWLGIAEALIGLTALLTPLALGVLQSAYAAIHPAIESSPAAQTAVRLAISFAVLIVPSALMGATLPLAVKSCVLEAGSLGGRIGVLYATNTAGAIAGSLVAGLALIPGSGIRTSFLAAAALNAVVALGAAAAGRSYLAVGSGRGQDNHLPVPEARGEELVAHGGARDADATVVLLVFAVSGFVSLALEVIWFRVLILFLRPTVYGYSMMLAAVLGGIAIGSYAAALLLRRLPGRSWMMTLGWLESAIGISSLLSFAVLPWIPALVRGTGPQLASLLGNYLGYQALVSFAVILPPMILFGGAFPIGLHVWTAASSRNGQLGTRVGLFYSLNVAGAIAGSLATGFILLPQLGSLKSLVLMGGLSVACAFALFGVAPGAIARRVASAAITAIAFVVALRATPDPFTAFLAQRYPGQEIVWLREAVQAIVSVHRDDAGSYTLNVSGNHQASTAGATPRVHQRIGNLPMIVHPDAREALVIGLGGGATAGALSQHTGVTVEVVELSREVTQAADRFFRSINFDVLRKPGVRLHVDDGRNFLLVTRGRYDVITADVILPIHAGSGNLYSVEYFTLARRALKPGGLVVQWAAGTEAEYKLIVRTFLTVFPETTLWADGSLLLGSVDPLRLRTEDFDWTLHDPARREMMLMLGVQDFEDLLGLYVAGPDELRHYAGEGPVLTDDRPLVEYFLSLPRDRQVDLTGVTGDVRRHVDSR
jgi:spermidine synthase